MLANDLLIDGFDRVHYSFHEILKEIKSEQLLYRPAKDANSIAWLLWHIARVEDDHIAELAGQDQLWQTSWRTKFDLPYKEDAHGYGQTSEEVGQMKATASQLTDYYDVVHARTVQYIKKLKAVDYEEVIDMRWDPPVTRAVRLMSVLNDATQHIGQAAYIKGSLIN